MSDVRSILAEEFANIGIVNFTVEEVLKMTPPVKKVYNILPTLAVLQKIRNIHGQIKLNSIYRTPEYNKEVGGAKKSMHMEFNAIDFKPTKMVDLEQIYHEIAAGHYNTTLYWNGKMTTVVESDISVGVYPTFIHIDTRTLVFKKKLWRKCD